jgi:hypothetical protein
MGKSERCNLATKYRRWWLSWKIRSSQKWDLKCWKAWQSLHSVNGWAWTVQCLCWILPRYLIGGAALCCIEIWGKVWGKRRRRGKKMWRRRMQVRTLEDVEELAHCEGHDGCWKYGCRVDPGDEREDSTDGFPMRRSRSRRSGYIAPKSSVPLARRG